MTTRNRSRRGAKSVATLDIENKIAKSKRELQGVKRAISQVKREDVSRRGGDLFGKMPPMFVSVPAMLGGAEAYFQEITSATPRAFNNAFGKNKGSRQLQLEAFKQFEKARDHDTKDQVDYITLASTIVPLMAYNLSQIADTENPAVISEIVNTITAYRTTFSDPTKSIKDSLDAAMTAIGGTSVLIALVTKSSALIYPLNPAYITARDKMMNTKAIGVENKAKFLLKSEVLAAYRKYALTHEPPMSVAVPSQITNAVKTSAPANKPNDLVAYFRDSASYSLEDTFNYYRDAFNSVASTHSARKSQEISKGLKVLNKAFDKFIEALSESLYDESVGEAIEIKSEVMELIQSGANAEDFLLAQAILEQARNPDPLVLNSGTVDEKTLDALGYSSFSSLELIDVLRESTVSNVSAADSDIWTAFHKVQQLLKELTDESTSLSDQMKIKEALKEAVDEARGSTRLDTVDTSFQTFANDQLKDIADGIVASFNSGFTESTGAWKTKNDIKNGVVNVINAMFKPYTDSGADIVSANTAWKLEAVAGVALNESALLDLAEGESLDIYIESEADPSLDEFASSEAELEIENLRIAFSAAGLKMTQFVELENFLRDCALEAQSIFDSIHMEASRRDDIAIFRNPSSLGILHQIGVGAAALVGTHATTALAQRFLNKDGKTEGTKYYAAEYVPAVLAAGAGAYMYHKQERPDIGLPLIGGAIGSVLLRVLTRRYVNKDNFISKYFLRYLGAAPAELIGDKTLGYINLEKQTSDLATKAAQLFIASSMLENDPKAIELRDSIPKNLSVLGLTITGETLSSGETKATHDEKIEAFKALQKTCAALEPMIAAYASKMLARGGVDTLKTVSDVAKAVSLLPAKTEEEDFVQGIRDELNLLTGQRTTRTPLETAQPQVVIPQTEPAAIQPVQGYIEDANTSGYQYPHMYAAPAGLGKYVSTPMHEPFYSYNPPTELRYSQAQQMLNKGYQLAGYGHQEAMEILSTAQPLGAHELHAEGLGGYIDETIIRATPASAQKLEDAGVATAVAQSNLVPNSYLMQIGTTGEEGGITPEYNPSLPSGTFAPQAIEPAQDEESVTSGLFSRGAFASRLPTAEDGFDY